MIFKLKDLVKIKYGKNQRKIECENGRYNILGTGGIIGKTNEFLYDKPSVLIGRKGTIDKIQYADEPFWTIDTLFYTEINEELVAPQYLYYKLLTIDFKNYNEGTTIPSLRTETLYEIELDIEEKEKQIKIIEILSKLDKKIILNNHINDNLLELIKTLYIEKIKNNNEAIFEDKTLDEFCNVFTGKKNANASEENGKYKFFTCAPEPLNINTYIYDGPAVIVAGNGAYTGRTNFYNGKFDLYQRTYGITTNNDYIYLFYAMIYTDLQNDIMGGTHGSAIPYIVMNDIAKFKVKYNKEIFDELSEKIKSLLLKIKNNELENETLTNLRDTLLPKLMNGEIDLDKIEI